MNKTKELEKYTLTDQAFENLHKGFDIPNYHPIGISFSKNNRTVGGFTIFSNNCRLLTIYSKPWGRVLDFPVGILNEVLTRNSISLKPELLKLQSQINTLKEVFGNIEILKAIDSQLEVCMKIPEYAVIEEEKVSINDK